MSRKLYDLAGKETDRRFSPYCWRAKLALAHKGLEVETVPWRFTEKDSIAATGSARVPILVDGERTVADSWAIAVYLEEAYPDRPTLFGGEGGRAVSRFVNAWADTVLNGAVVRIVLLDICDHLGEQDRDYFRRSREARFGKPLEEVVADREGNLAALRAALEPLRVTLGAQPFLGGEAPLYADHIVFGAFMWARAISPVALLASDDPVAAWRARMLEAFGGMGAKALGYAAA